MLSSVSESLRDVLGHSVSITRCSPVSGGCIHCCTRLHIDSGQSFFLKWSPRSSVDLFEAEAAGLRELDENVPLRVPRVVGTDSVGEGGWLLLEFVEAGRPTPDFWESLGAGLAALHTDTVGPIHGADRHNYIGPLPQDNEPRSTWSEFWWEARLSPQLEAARRSGHRLPDGGSWEELRRRLGVLLEPANAEGLSLLHGDLWSGNVMTDSEGHPVLVDPSVYRGHREVDLAMTELFGGFGPGFYDSYWSRWPLSAGYEAVRRDVYQLYPLLVHVNLFGSSYSGAVSTALDRILSS